MAKDDEAARKKRADDIRKQIADLKRPQDEAKGVEDSSQTEDSEAKGGPGLSPRDFIHKRMRELEEEEK